MSPLTTRSKILSGANKLLKSASPLGIRANSVAEVAGVSPSLVHYHFPTLELLFTEAAVNLYAEHAAEERLLLEAEGVPLTVLMTWHRMRRAWMLEHSSTASLLSVPKSYPVDRYPKWRKSEQLLVDGLTPVIAELHKDLSSREARRTAQQWLLITFVTDLDFTEIYKTSPESVQTAFRRITA